MTGHYLDGNFAVSELTRRICCPDGLVRAFEDQIKAFSKESSRAARPFLVRHFQKGTLCLPPASHTSDISTLTDPLAVIRVCDTMVMSTIFMTVISTTRTGITWTSTQSARTARTSPGARRIMPAVDTSRDMSTVQPAVTNACRTMVTSTIS
jgi:hypothetical protein